MEAYDAIMLFCSTAFCQVSSVTTLTGVVPFWQTATPANKCSLTMTQTSFAETP